MSTDAFLRFFLPRPAASRLLVCFPHAGGGASGFRAWPYLFDDNTEVAVVQYPGREDRFSEPRIDNMEEMLTTLTAELLPILSKRPFLMLGHSMGGALAHELAMRFSDLGVAPDHLIVSGRQPPCHHPLDSTIYCGSDEEILGELLRLSPGNLALAQEPELAALLLPIVRTDYRLIETYRPGEPRILDCPITVLAGEDDSELSRPQAEAWSRYTRSACRVHSFPGDHFFIASQRSRVVATLRNAILGKDRA